MTSWHERYSQNFRDALAHRIPLYVPPFGLTPSAAQRYQELEKEIIEQMRNRDRERLKALITEQEGLGTVVPSFGHSFSDFDSPGIFYIHPQIIADAMTVIELTSTVRRVAFKHPAPMQTATKNGQECGPCL